MVKIHPTVTWTVVFTKATGKHWVQKLLDPYFQHCYIMRDEGDHWLIIDPLKCHIVAKTVTKERYPTINSYIMANDVTINVTARIIDRDRSHFCVINCVEVVKGFLGIKDFWCWTPLDLYNLLRR